MGTTIRIAAAQTPEFREEIAAATGYMLHLVDEAQRERVSLLCLPECFLQGYLTDGQAARRHALDLGSPAFAALLRMFPPDAPTTVFGLVEIEGDRLFNTAVVVHRQTLIGRYRKTHLLSRERCFHPGDGADVFAVDGLRFGINICFDTNFPAASKSLADRGASLIVCPANNMLPRHTAEKYRHAHNAVRAERCRETGMWLVSADVTGERDGKIGWGPTAVLSPSGDVAAQLPLDGPGLLVFDLPVGSTSI